MVVGPSHTGSNGNEKRRWSRRAERQSAQNAPPVVIDHKEAIQHAEREHGEQMKGTIAYSGHGKYAKLGPE